MIRYLIAASLATLVACSDATTGKSTAPIPVNLHRGNYAYDAAFLKDHTRKVIELSNRGGQSKILLSGDYQGRVMTSTARGDSGTSYGWLNYDLIAQPSFKKQFNPVGGEERFWLGPEGGQYSLYFKRGVKFSFENWQVPPIIDTIAYEVESADNSSAVFSHTATLTNYSGTVFNFDIRRKITLLDRAAAANLLKVVIPEGLASVAYTTENSIKNTGERQWTKKSGLISIWLLAMLTPSDNTKVIIPFKAGGKSRNLITTDYFGEVPPDRLSITDSFLVLNCDGKLRSKIGIPPSIAAPVAGSFDFDRNILTITLFTVDPADSYVNSRWELQEKPYAGDAVNAYNDGPLADGSQMGPFYEIESSSAAKELRPGEEQVYKQTTFHFEGSFADLETLAQHVLHVRLSDLR